MKNIRNIALALVVLLGVVVGLVLTYRERRPTIEQKVEIQNQQTHEAIRKKAVDSVSRLRVDSIKSRAWSDPDVR